MIEVIMKFFGNNISNLERFVGVVGVGEILTLFLTIFVIVYKGKKFDKATEQIKKEANEERKKFEEKHEEAIKTLREENKKSIDNLCNMFLIEATKSGVDLEKFNAIVDIYKKTITYEALDTDKLQEEKEKEIAQEQTNQEQVNENLKNIEALSEYV